MAMMVLRLGWEAREEWRRYQMNSFLFTAYVTFQELLNREEGQDLVEYALLVTLIALGSITAIGYVTTGLVGMFSYIGKSV
jgi:pilus assembly protein Flp/PilA